MHVDSFWKQKMRKFLIFFLRQKQSLILFRFDKNLNKNEQKHYFNVHLISINGDWNQISGIAIIYIMLLLSAGCKFIKLSSILNLIY